MPPAINLKTVTNNVGWSLLSKTTTFGLKFVTVPILARILRQMPVLAASIRHNAADRFSSADLIGRIESMALFRFQTRNPNRDRETDAGRLQRLHRMLDDLCAEMARERNGLRDRYEKVAADAAFSQQALENDRVEASMSSKIADMTDTMIRYRERIQSLEKQIDFVTDLSGQVEVFSQGNAGESLSAVSARASRG